jgi:arylsulfatase A-like enzyme
MTRPTCVLLAAAIAVLAAAGCRKPAPVASAPRHVVLVSIDTLRSDHLGAYGYARPTSPRLDALAREGVLFEEARAPSPWTLPSHASLFTGLYPSRHHARQHAALPPSVTTLATLLAANGFATAAVVNSQNLSETFGLHRGFQQFQYVVEATAQREPSRAITDRATGWLREHRDDRLFLFVHYYDVHSDYASLPEYEQQFVRPYTGIATGSTPQLSAIRRGELTFGPDDVAHLIDLYDAGIRQMDDEIGRLVAAIGDDTLLIVTSDHGEEFLEHGEVLHGRSQFEPVLRVPLIMRGPGVPAATRVATIVSLIDVMPTVLAAVGVPIPTGLDGSDLAPTWHGGGADLGGRYFIGEADHHEQNVEVMRAVRHYRDKLHVNARTGAETLFDLDRDPGELVDVARERPEIVQALRAELDRVAAVRRTGGVPVTLTPEQVERLKSLGYVP